MGDICKGITTDISSWYLRLFSVVLGWNFMPWSLPREAVIEASISLFLDTEKLTFETFHLMTNTYYFSLLVLFYISFSFYLQPYANRIAKYLKGKHRKIPVVYFANGGSCFIHKQIDMHGFWRSVHRLVGPVHDLLTMSSPSLFAVKLAMLAFRARIASFLLSRSSFWAFYIYPSSH